MYINLHKSSCLYSQLKVNIFKKEKKKNICYVILESGPAGSNTVQWDCLE